MLKYFIKTLNIHSYTMAATIIKGIILPAGWDKKGKVQRLAVATQQEEEFLVEDIRQIKKLKPFLRREVEILGILGVNNNKKIIDVRKVNPK